MPMNTDAQTGTRTRAPAQWVHEQSESLNQMWAEWNKLNLRQEYLDTNIAEQNQKHKFPSKRQRTDDVHVFYNL